ncbi:hypothetical protein J4229_02820 [Candidatus Pacearchaeota archaeon]|nr:hypothetical protein [Candidatus Pacearchaeota archaeon]
MMKKEDIENISGKLSEIKDALNELESALKYKDASKGARAKIKIINLQSQISRMI